MNKSDEDEFGRLLNAVMSVSRFGKPVGPDAFDMWWHLLSGHSVDVVAKALDAHSRRSGDAPTPHDILEIVSEGLGYPSPEEAWNRLPKDERDGGYVNQQMMDGLSACSDSLDRGDMIAARMAFIESYKKSVGAAKMNNVQAIYFYSSPTGVGEDERKEKKHQDLLLAIDLGWVDGDSSAVRQTLAITSEPSPVALEDLTKKMDSKIKRSALESIRSKLTNTTRKSDNGTKQMEAR